MNALLGILLLFGAFAVIVHRLWIIAYRQMGSYEMRYKEQLDPKQLEILPFIGPEQLRMLRRITAALLSTITMVIALPLGVSASLLFAISVGAMGHQLPAWVVRILVWLRRKRFLSQFPNALDMLSSALKAGQSLSQAIDLVATQMPRPVSEEFRLARMDCQVGLSVEQALKRMADRLPLEDVRIFVMVAGLASRTGGNVTEAFSRVAETIRNRAQLEQKVKTLTAEIRLQAFIIALIPFVMLWLMNQLAPEMMAPIYQGYLWIILLALIIFLETIAVVIMWKIADIKY